MEVEMLSCRRELRTAASRGDRELEGVTHPEEDGAAGAAPGPGTVGMVAPAAPADAVKGNPPWGALGRAEPARQDTGLGHFGLSRGMGVTAAPESTEHEPQDIPQISPAIFQDTAVLFPLPFPQSKSTQLAQGTGPPTWPKRWEGAVLVQPGEGCLREALHAGCGHHAIERLEEGPDDDTELVGSEELRTSIAVTMVSLLPGVGITLLWQQDRLSCLDMELLRHQDWPWNRPAGCLPSTGPYLALAQTAGVMT